MCLLVGILRLVVWVTSGAVGAYEAECRPAAAAFGDGLVGQRLADAPVPGLPLGEGVWWAVHVGSGSSQRAESLLGAQIALPGLRDLWGCR